MTTYAQVSGEGIVTSLITVHDAADQDRLDAEVVDIPEAVIVPATSEVLGFQLVREPVAVLSVPENPGSGDEDPVTVEVAQYLQPNMEQDPTFAPVEAEPTA